MESIKLNIKSDDSQGQQKPPLVKNNPCKSALSEHAEFSLVLEKRKNLVDRARKAEEFSGCRIFLFLIAGYRDAIHISIAYAI